MAINATVRISLREDEPSFQDLRRLCLVGERHTVALRRMITRYSDLIANTPASESYIVRDLAAALANEQHLLMSPNGYPDRIKVVEAINRSTININQRHKLANYVSELTYAEYARLIESVEMLNYT